MVWGILALLIMGMFALQKLLCVAAPAHKIWTLWIISQVLFIIIWFIWFIYGESHLRIINYVHMHFISFSYQDKYVKSAWFGLLIIVLHNNRGITDSIELTDSNSFILSSILRQLPDLFYISTKLCQDHHRPQPLQQQCSQCTWRQARTHLGEPEQEPSTPQPDVGDQQQPDFKESHPNVGPQQCQQWDKRRAPEHSTRGSCHGCSSLLQQNCVPVWILDHHAGLCVGRKSPGDNCLYIWQHENANYNRNVSELSEIWCHFWHF